MKLQNLSTRTFLRLMVGGASLTSILLLSILYAFTKDIKVILGGFSVMILLFFWGAVFLHYFQKKLSVFTDGLCRTLDEMMDSTVRPQINYEAETLLARISHRLERLYHVMQETRHKVEEEKAELQSLVSDISHQTKTPLTNISLYTELLLEKDLPKEAEECALQVRGQAEKLQFLLHTLICSSRLENGIITLYPKKQGVRKMVEAAVLQIRPKAQQRGIRIEVGAGRKDRQPEERQLEERQLEDRQLEERQAVFDEKWTQEALYNLLDNAVKYTDPGDWIEVCWTEYELFLRIDVTDHGIGIPEQETGRIFGRFVRGEQVRNQEGVGIGLYLADQIVTGEGGYLKVKSIPGERTTFSMFLSK